MSLRPETERKAQQIPERPSSLLERARALAPLVEREAEDAERRGSLSPTVVDALSTAGVFRMLLPQEH